MPGSQYWFRGVRRAAFIGYCDSISTQGTGQQPEKQTSVWWKSRIFVNPIPFVIARKLYALRSSQFDILKGTASVKIVPQFARKYSRKISVQQEIWYWEWLSKRSEIYSVLNSVMVLRTTIWSFHDVNSSISWSPVPRHTALVMMFYSAGESTLSIVHSMMSVRSVDGLFRK